MAGMSSPDLPEWLSRRVGWVTGIFRTAGTAPAVMAQATRPFTEVVRSLGERVTAAEETAKALTTMPKRMRHGLTVITMHCLGDELLLKVFLIPTHLPGAAYDTHLVVPTSAVTYQHEDERVTARAWFLGEDAGTFGVRCRCHPEVRLTADQVRGVSAPPLGIRRKGRVLKS